MGARLLFVSLLLLSLISCNANKPPAPHSENNNSSTAITPVANAATLSGTMNFEGPAPARTTIDMGLDPACAQTSKEPNLDERIVVNNSHLANVFVYVSAGAPNGSAPPQQPVVIDQLGCRYRPHVLGMVAGQTLRILNSDTAMHNVHPVSKNNREWNVTQMPQSKPVDTTFDHPELMLPVTCNQHNWMKMYVNVVSTPFFAVTGANGRFEISGLPPGEYALTAVHEKLGKQELKIKVGPSEKRSDLAFTFRQ